MEVKVVGFEVIVLSYFLQQNLKLNFIEAE
jgi:hypothetical protein